MLKLTPEKLKEIFQDLPKDVKDAVFSVDSSKVIRGVGEKKNLTVDKIGELADEVGLVMFGLTHPKDFIANLSKRLEIDRGKAKEIAEEINTQLFSKIRESLKQVHGLGGKKEEKEPEIKDPAAMKQTPSIKVPPARNDSVTRSIDGAGGEKKPADAKPIEIKPISPGFSDIKKEIDEKKAGEVFGDKDKKESRIDIDKIAPEKSSLEEEIGGIKEISMLRKQEELKEESPKVSEEAVDGQAIKKDLLKEIEVEEDNKPIEKPESVKPIIETKKDTGQEEKPLGQKLKEPFEAKTGEAFRIPPEETIHTVSEEKKGEVSLGTDNKEKITSTRRPLVDPYREPAD